jgi:hypothetical protein
MKKYWILPLFVLLACNHNRGLSANEAYQLITDHMHYPIQLSHTINQVDPVQGDVARSSTLIHDGYLSVIEPGHEIPKGRDMIELTDKGKAYLLDDMAEQHELKVKTARASLSGPEAVSVHMLKDNHAAVATYTVNYTEQTPFTAMVPQRDFTKPVQEKAYFVLNTDGKWQLEENPGEEFMNLPN